MSSRKMRINNIAQAIEITSEARVVTLGHAPFKIVHTNKGWHDVTGYKFTEIANQTSAFLQGPDTETKEERTLVKAVGSGKHAKVKLLNYTKAGEPFFNTLECFPLHNTGGELTHFCGVLTAEPADASRYKRRVGPSPQLAASSKRASPDGMSDGEISRRPTHEAHLPPPPHRPKRSRGEKMRLPDALNNDYDAVVMTQPYPPYAITHVNAPWCEMCGYGMEEVVGLSNSILQGPETDQEILEGLMASVTRGEATSATLVNYKKGGERFVNQVQVMPVYNEDNEIDQFMAMLHEVDSV